MEKVGTIALVLGGTSLLVSGLTAALMTVGYGGRIVDLEEKLALMGGTLTKTGLVATDTAGRVGELDIGLTALARVAKVDPIELSKGIAQERERISSESKAADKPSTSAESEPAPAATAGSLQGTAPVESAVSQAKAEEPAQPMLPPPAPAPAPDEPMGVQNAALELQEGDNPFAPLTEEAQAESRAAAKPLAIAVKADPVTVEKVDALLARRISESWVKPAGKIDDLSVAVEIRLGRSGNIADAKVLQSSGSKDFDASALAAIRAIGRIEEVSQLSEEDYQAAYAKRSILFTPELGR